MVTAPIAGRWVDEGEARLVLQIGFGASAVGTALSMLIAAMGGSWVWFLGATVVFGIGNGFVMAPLTTVGMTALRGDEFGAASSLLNEAYSWGVGEYESEDGCDGFWEGL